jgi:hypothetical protein
MGQLSQFPYFEVQFNKAGNIVDPHEVEQVVEFVVHDAISDLLVISHGWNNDMDDARQFYAGLVACLRHVLDQRPALGAGRTFAILGVLWPSKKFAEQELIPGGAASMNAGLDRQIKRQIDQLKGAFDARGADKRLKAAGRLIARLENDPAARREFAELLRPLLPASDGREDEVPQQFFALGGEQLMELLSKPAPIAPGNPGDIGGAAAMPGAMGGAAGFGQMLVGIEAAALNLLNYVTYYQMKSRAGIVGRGGLYQVLSQIRGRRPDLKLHMIGHSFGGRLVTAATDGPDNQPSITIQSMTLLQAAFSHYGFAENYSGDKDGLFRKVMTDHKVAGPMLISHTPNDTAVGLAYPIASRIADQVAADLGDANDPFGGIGRNGAQKTPEAIDGEMMKVGGSYTFKAGKVYNLSADAFIKSHSDVVSDAVAYAILSAVATV